MKLRSILKQNLVDLVQHRFLMMGSFFGILIALIPLQRFITMSRYEHYGLAVGVFGLGFLLEIGSNWKQLNHWRIASYLLTGLFFSSLGLVLIFNPWLDYKLSIQTEEQEHWRSIVVSFYMLFGLTTSIVWLRLSHEDMQIASKQEIKEKNIQS